VNTDVVMRFIEEVAQSNANFELDHGLDMQLTHVQAPQGTGRRRTLESWETKV
jgi:hypothetical protein